MGIEPADSSAITDLVSNNTGTVLHATFTFHPMCPCLILSGEGYTHADVYTQIFAQPSQVQLSVQKPAKERKSADLQAIAHMLHALDFFRR